MNRSVLALAVLAALTLSAAACAPAVDGVATDQAAPLTAEDAARILDLVNDPAMSLDALDKTVGLDARAARGIVAFRAGADGVMPTADDHYFSDIPALEAVPYVGASAISKLGAYALAHPSPTAEVVEGISFRGWEAQAVLWGVNHDAQTALDAIVDNRAAAGLVAHRPFATVTTIGPVAYVGPSALASLRAHAPTWWAAQRASGEPSLAGTFDGVVFDDPTATVALGIANDATGAQLTAHGISAAPAARIIGARPYGTLAEIAAVSGVGPVTMTALRAYARSGAWVPPADCTASFAAAVAPHLADLLFMSESDRPIELVSFPGQGAAAPTGASVLALVDAAAGSAAEQRDVANYFVAFEPSSGSADANAAKLVEAAVRAQLTDLVYIAVHKPMSDPYHAEVAVYLLGRTACGDLVGLKSVAVET